MKTMVLLGSLLLAVFCVGTCAVGTQNELVRHENGIKAQYKQNQNSFAEMANKVREVAQVPEMYAADLEKITRAAIEGRYGEGGSKAVVQFIQEAQITVDASLYARLQQVIESSRTKFSAEQQMLLDKKRVYENQLGTFPNSMVASLFGFPKINLDEYDIVTSDETEEAFRKKKAGPMKLR